MAANEIIFRVKVEKDGNLKITAKEAEAAAQSTKKLGTETDKTTKSRNRYNKAEKGVGQAGLSSGKAFAKMNQTMGGGGGLVAAYAVLAANIFALTAAFGALSRAAQVDKLKEGMVAMGQATGVAMNALSEGLVKTTGHAISLEEAMRTTAQVTSAGFDPSVIERLGSVARMASQALGRDLGDAMQRITKGAIKMEPELLDELGIMVRLDDATEAYAASINKNVDELTKFEKQQAFMNAVLEEGESKFAALGDVPVNPYTKLAATFADLTTNVLTFLNKGLEPLVSLLASSTPALVGALVIFASTVGKIAQPALAAFTGKLTSMAAKSKQAAIAQLQFTGITGKGSKEVLKLKEALAKGVVTKAQWTKGLNASIKSMAGYNVQVNKNSAATGRFSKETRASRANLAQATRDHYGLIKAKRDLDIANIKNSATSAMNTLTTQGAIAAMGVLWGEMTAIYLTTFRASAGMTLFARALAVVRGAALAAASGFAVLGAAILAAMNVIGLVIMVIMGLWEVAKWLWSTTYTDEENALTAAAESASTALKDTQANLKELDASLAGHDSKVQGIVMQYASLNNILNTTAQEYRKLADAQAASDASGIFTKDGDEAQGASVLVKHMLSLAKGSKVMQKTLADAGISMESLENGTITLDELNKGMALVSKTNKEVNTRFMAMAAAIDGLNLPLTNFLNKIKQTTDVDELVAGFKDLQLTLMDPNLTTGADKLAALTAKADDSLLRLLGTSKKQLDNAKGNLIIEASLFSMIQKRFKLLKELFEKEQRQQVLYKQNIKNLKLESKLIKTLTGTRGVAAKLFDKELEIREATAERMQEEIDLQIELNQNRKEGSNISLEILQLEQELALFKKLAPPLEQRSIDIAKESLEIAKEQRVNKTAEMEVLKRMVGLTAELVDYEIDAAERAKENSNRNNPQRKYDPSLNAKDKVDLDSRIVPDFLKINEDLSYGVAEGLTAAEARVEAARSDMHLTLAKIDLEEGLLRLKFELLKAEHALVLQQTNLANKARWDKNNARGIAQDPFVPQQMSASTTEMFDKMAATLEKSGLMTTLQKAVVAEAFKKVKGDIETESANLKSDQDQEVMTAKGDTSLDRMLDANQKGGISSLDHMSQKIGAFRNIMAPMIEDLRALGPEGELASSVISGGAAMSETWAHVGEVFAATGEELASGPERAAAVMGAISASLGAVGSIMQAQSNARIANIDKEIEAEKKRDGKSAASIAKIKKLEAKKVAAQKKAFEINKKMQIAQVAINTAAAMVAAAAAAASAAAGSGVAAPITFASVFAGMGGVIAAIGAATIATIMGTSFQGGGGGSAASTGPKSISVGTRRNTVDTAKSQGGSGELAYMRGAQGTGGPENFRGAFYGKKHRAAGGDTGYIVGEQGPELFMPDRPGTIVPADDTAAMGGGSNVTFNISTVDATGVEDLLAEQQGNIIGMLRQAANSYGEEFMEDIDTTAVSGSSARRA